MGEDILVIDEGTTTCPACSGMVPNPLAERVNRIMRTSVG